MKNQPYGRSKLDVPRLEVTGGKIGTSAVDPVLSIRQTAEVLNLSERSLWRLISAGKIRMLRLSARKRGVLASEIARVQSEAAA